MAFKDVSDTFWKESSLLKIGTMTVVCPYCNAIRFENECASICCANGKVKIDELQRPPKLLRLLLSGEHPDSSNFLTYIRAYNNAFSFTSFGTTVYTNINL